jgi:hypothetical protein
MICITFLPTDNLFFFLVMVREKLPYQVIGIYFTTCIAQRKPNIKRMATRPGMSTTFYRHKGNGASCTFGFQYLNGGAVFV